MSGHNGDGEVRVTSNGSVPNLGNENDVTGSMAHLQHEMAMRTLKHKLEEFQLHMVQDMKTKISCMISDVIKELQSRDLHVNEFHGLTTEKHTEMWSNRSKVQREKGQKFPDKVFVARDSLFTCLYRVSHMKTIYHTFIVMLIVMIMNTAIHDYFTEGRINFGQHTISGGMKGFWRGVGIWCGMQTAVFLVYFGLKSWADIRLVFRKNESLRHLWDAICLFLFVSFQLFFMYAGCYAVVKLDLAFVAGCSVLLENTRFVMKMHAFVRTITPRLLIGKLKVDNENDCNGSSLQYPTLSQFVYYLFAPTFIYRDSYPRTSRINWSFAGARLLEVVGVMFFMANIHERYIFPNFGQFGKEEITVNILIVKLFSMVLPGFLIFLSGFYCILHSWLNFTSELLRFSDRMFYKDWWNSPNFDSYYRNWNVVVHDWLYEFIYKDFYNYVCKRSKTLAILMVFIVSAVVHEYILAVAMRFFYPVMLTFFGIFGVTVIFLTRKINKTIGNIFLWLTLSTGNGLLISLYAIEIFARRHCDPVNDSWTSYFIPVSWSCNQLKY